MNKEKKKISLSCSDLICSFLFQSILFTVLYCTALHISSDQGDKNLIPMTIYVRQWGREKGRERGRVKMYRAKNWCPRKEKRARKNEKINKENE